MRENAALDTGLDLLFDPRSIAVVGVSSSGRGLGATTLKAIRRFGFSGELSIVNPSMQDFDGVASYPSLRDIPGGADLVLMFTPADRVEATLEESISIGARVGVVYASGFSEVGDRGLALQRRIANMSREAGFRILGPNCQGLVVYSSRLAATFSNAIRGIETSAPTPIAYVGQSGAIGGSILDLGRERGCLPAVWVSTGNQADIGVVEVADYLLNRDDLSTLLVYLEQMPNGRSWEELCTRSRDKGKQIVVLRSGTTPAGRGAVASHTGALVGPDRGFEILSSNHGVISVRDVHEVLDIAMAHRAGLADAGRALAIVTTSGGAGGIAADAAFRAGLTVPQLSDTTRQRLQAALPSFATSQNPVDVTADLVSTHSERLGDICTIIGEDPKVDQILVVLSVVVGRSADNLAHSIVGAAANSAKPVTVAYVASRDRTESARNILRSGGVTVFDSISAALEAAGRVNRVPCLSDATAAPNQSSTPDTSVTVITEAEGSVHLDAVGIARPRGVLARSREEAIRAAQELGHQVVLKVQSKEVTHKSDVGAVRVGVTPSAAGIVYDEILTTVTAVMPWASIDGVLVQEMAPEGVELLVGVQTQSHGYPPLVTVGFGGTSVELYADVASQVLPIDQEGAVALLATLRGWPLLDGYRSRPAADIEAAARTIVAMGELSKRLGERLVDMEINPLIVHEAGGGATAADFVAYVRTAEAT